VSPIICSTWRTNKERDCDHVSHIHWLYCQPPFSKHADVANFVDAMDVSNYISVELPKPMGVVFEENDEKYGGIFVLSLADGSAQKEGTIRPGDELVAVGGKKVAGLPFDDALGAIIDSDAENTKLVFFRGSAKDFYGPTGASQEWLDEFIAKA